MGTTLKARPGDTLIEAGGEATLMVRPERVRVTMEQPAGDVAAGQGDGAFVDVLGTDFDAHWHPFDFPFVEFEAG